ncbi:MAG: hypothetical protein AB1776_03545 [Bacillota bacterium]
MFVYFAAATAAIFGISLFLRDRLGARAAFFLAGPSLVLAYLFPPALVHLGLAKSLALYGAAIPIAGSLLWFFLPGPALTPQAVVEVPPATGENAGVVEIDQKTAVAFCPVTSGSPGAGSVSPGQVEPPFAAEEETPGGRTDPENLPAPADLVREAASRRRQGDFAGAARLYRAALAATSDPHLQYLIVNELSGLYQQLGRYALAAELIQAFLLMRVPWPPALTAALREKMVFNRYLHETLARKGMPGLPYREVPEIIRRRACLEATKK